MVFMLQIVLNKTVPLCSAQYERQFNTTRIPGLETGWYRCRYSLLPCVLVVYRQAMVHHHAFLRDGNGSAAIRSSVPSPCYLLGIIVESLLQCFITDQHAYLWDGTWSVSTAAVHHHTYFGYKSKSASL